MARPGDLVLAFNGSLVHAVNGNELHPERHSVRWAGIVADVVPLEDYWDDPRFGGKKPGRSRGYPDNIYRLVTGGFEQVPNPTHTLENMSTDIGGARSLVFQTIWYFGRAAPMLPEHFGLRMNGGRRMNLSWEINQPTERELKLWLDDAKAHAGCVRLPIVDPSGPVCPPAKREGWIAAGKVLAVDPSAAVLCPVCQRANLVIQNVSIAGQSKFERIMNCPGCNSRNILALTAQ
jgi:hypothetical protein